MEVAVLQHADVGGLIDRVRLAAIPQPCAHERLAPQENGAGLTEEIGATADGGSDGCISSHAPPESAQTPRTHHPAPLRVDDVAFAGDEDDAIICSKQRRLSRQRSGEQCVISGEELDEAAARKPRHLVPVARGSASGRVR